jgi:hypothetical protein
MHGSTLIVLFAGALSMVGCNATTPAMKGPEVALAPEYPTLKLESLAYLGVATTSPDPLALPVSDGLLRSYLTGGQQKFLIVDVDAVRVRAQKEGVADQLAQVIRVWKDKQTIDRFQIRTLGEKLGFDGFLVASVDQWRKEQVDWTSEGTSFTEVGMKLSIYEARNGILAWTGEKMERRESAYYRPGSGGTGVYNEGDVGRTERAGKLTPPPPPPEQVAESVVKALVDALPPKPGSATSTSENAKP